MPAREILPGHRRERVVNYGDAATVGGNGKKALFHWNAEQATAVAVTVWCEAFDVPSGAVGSGDFRPFVHVKWGHGATDMEFDFDATYRQRIPLVASTVAVECFIASL